MKRQMGILLSIPSLPSLYGIGDFGKEARQFIDMLDEHHVTLWQILPMNPMGYGHSPYQPYSSKAGEPLLISLDELLKDGYIKAITPQTFPADSIDYEAVESYKEAYYQEAYQTMKNDAEKKETFEAFKVNQPWVNDYGTFYAFKKHHGLRSWLEWDEDYKNWPKTKNQDLVDQHHEAIDYAIFLQYLFYEQWHRLKDYAHFS